MGHATCRGKAISTLEKCDDLVKKYNVWVSEGIGFSDKSKAVTELEAAKQKALIEYEAYILSFKDLVVKFLITYEKNFQLYHFVLSGLNLEGKSDENTVALVDQYYEYSKPLLKKEETGVEKEIEDHYKDSYKDLVKELKAIPNALKYIQAIGDLVEIMARLKIAVAEFIENSNPLNKYTSGSKNQALRQWGDLCILSTNNCLKIDTKISSDLKSTLKNKSLKDILSDLISLLNLDLGPKQVRLTGIKNVVSRDSFVEKVCFGIYAIKGGKAERVGENAQNYPDTKTLSESIKGANYGDQQWIERINSILGDMTDEKKLTQEEREMATSKQFLTQVHAEEVWLHLYWKELKKILETDKSEKAIERFEILDSLVPCANNQKNCEVRIFGRLAKMIKKITDRSIPMTLFTFRDDESQKYHLDGAEHKQLVYDLEPDTGQRKFIGVWRDPDQDVKTVKESWLLSGMKILTKEEEEIQA